MIKKQSALWDRWIALSTIIIAGSALTISLWQGYILQQHNRLTVRPFLQFELNTDGDSSFSLYLNNNGLGPAEVHGSAIYWKGKQLQTITDVWKELGVTKESKCIIPQGYINRFYKVGDSQMITRNDFKGGCNLKKEQLQTLIDNLEIDVSYRSLYGEEFNSNIEK